MKVEHRDVTNLATDYAQIASLAKVDLSVIVHKHIRTGRLLARENAKRTAGRHGKHYPASITEEMTSTLRGEYGPDPALPQGGMSFENGSRKQPPHNDLAKSADVIGPMFAQAVDQQVDDWFNARNDT